MRCLLLVVAAAQGLVPPEARRCVGGFQRQLVLSRASKSDFEAAKQQFLGEAEFDALSLREWRRETLIRYSNANQSEPLRILLSLLVALSCFGCVSIADAIGAPAPQGLELGGYYCGGVLSSGLFLRERGRRTRRLLKIDRECAVGDLSVVVRPSAAAFPGATKTASLRSLRNEYRVVAALCDDGAAFDAFGRDAKGLRRRLASSKVLALAVNGAQIDATAACSPSEPKRWLSTFGDLLTTDDAWGDFDFESRTQGHDEGALM